MGQNLNREELLMLNEADEKLNDVRQQVYEKYQEFDEMISEAQTMILRAIGMSPVLDKSGVYSCQNCDELFNRGERPDKCPHCGYKVRWL